MKQLTLTLIAALITFSMNAQLPKYQDSSLSIEERVEDLLSRMTLEEKMAQMQQIHSYVYDNNGTVDMDKLIQFTGGLSFGCIEAVSYTMENYADAAYKWQKFAKEGTRLGIPFLTCSEGLHGIVQDGCTIYPQAIAQGATFNPELIEEMGRFIASEGRAIGVWQILSPCLDIAREPRWGRVEETFGEDPYMNGINGSAFVSGIQSAGLITTPKHFTAHGTPQGGLNLASVAGGKYDLYNTYIQPFRMVIESCDPMSIMNCYSSYDGEVVAGSRYMLTELLRDKLGFNGYVYSDWGSIDMMRYFHKVCADQAEAAKKAIEAGLDLEAGGGTFTNIKQMVEDGRLDIKYVDQAVRRILHAKFSCGAFDAPLPDKNDLKTKVHTPEAVAHAKKMALESAVLLENKNNILPLDGRSLKSVAIIGPNADKLQFGDYSYSNDKKYGTTPLDGIKGLVGKDITINYAEGCDLWSSDRSGFKEAVKAAKKSDVTIVFVGAQSALLARPSDVATTGEGFDLNSLKLPGVQEELIDEICTTGKPVIVVLVTGKPFEMTRIKEKVQALAVQWYAGEKQGEAIADLLFGKENFSGRLPISFPKSTGSLPCFYNHLPSDKGFYNVKGTPETPGRDYVFADPYSLYTFGYGLSYSSFEYEGMEVSTIDGNNPAGAGKVSADDTVKAVVKVRNTSDRTGKETVQIYSSDPVSSLTTPSKKLVGYKKVEIQPGETQAVEILIPMASLGFYDSEMNLLVEPGDFNIMACSSSENVHFTSVVTVPAETTAQETAETEDQASTSAATGEIIHVNILIRDIQSGIIEGAEMIVGGNVIGKTDRDGKCEADVASGQKVRFTKKGYSPVELVIESAGNLNLTMIPKF